MNRRTFVDALDALHRNRIEELVKNSANWLEVPDDFSPIIELKELPWHPYAEFGRYKNPILWKGCADITAREIILLQVLRMRGWLNRNNIKHSTAMALENDLQDSKSPKAIPRQALAYKEAIICFKYAVGSIDSNNKEAIFWIARGMMECTTLFCDTEFELREGLNNASTHITRQLHKKRLDAQHEINRIAKKWAISQLAAQGGGKSKSQIARECAIKLSLPVGERNPIDVVVKVGKRTIEARWFAPASIHTVTP